MSDSRAGKLRESWCYSGEVWTDETGRAVVVLPSFVRTHRYGFEYELEPIGPGCAATVAQEVADDRFTIATDRPHVKVAWRVTPVRASTVDSASRDEGRRPSPPTASTSASAGRLPRQSAAARHER